MKIENFKLKINFPLCAIFLLAAFFRLYGIDWDQGFHLHPDERAIVMFTTPLRLPNTIGEFLTPSSPLNPHFFAYGNFPLYLLKTISSIAGSIDQTFAMYDKINLVGRFVSVLIDLGTIIILFLLSQKVFNTKIALFASLFYALSVFPIQASHFYAVDVLLTFFITLTLYQLVRFYENPSLKNSVLSGVFFGLSLATKVSAIPLVIAILLTITVDFLLLFIRQPHKPHIWFPHLPRFLKRLIFDGLIIASFTLVSFALFQPYAIIDFQEFLKQNLLQSQMTHNAFVFPYTLQYVGKIPYLYELKNVFFWGLGPLLASISFAGIAYFAYLIFKKAKTSKGAKEIILFTFFVTYFFVVGKFAVGWMRYMLPLYPLFALFAAISFLRLLSFLPVNFRNLFAICYLLFAILWPLSFLHIYAQPNTRVLASNWINSNIPQGSTLAIEHWDDSLPLSGQGKYHILTLELYNPDTSFKWQIIHQQLAQTDYIIIASNRLYVPLQKLTDCQTLPQEHCYPLTADYYKRLFGGKFGFQKIAEFSVSPTIPIFNIPIDDQNADESFTVYDHPKVMIFKKWLDE